MDKSNYQQANPKGVMPTNDSTSTEEGTPGIEPALLEDSAFIAGLRARFFSEGVPQWPPAGMTLEAEIADLSAATGKLLFKCEKQASVVTVSGTPGSAENIVSNYLASLGWPGSPPEIPEQWRGTAIAFRRFEVGRAVDVMLQSFHMIKGGGPGQGWPPRNPSR